MKSLIRFFAESKLTPLMVVAAILLGVGALMTLPREEEPQIKVPMVDVFVQFPGGTVQEVQKRIVELGERKLWEIPNVEYIYTQARREGALFILRFKVGTQPSESLIQAYTKVMANADLMPVGAPQPLIKPRSIDDVPFLTLTFSSDKLSPMEIRQRVVALQQRINAVSNVAETTVIGGKKEIYLVEPKPAELDHYGITLSQIQNIIAATNSRGTVGDIQADPKSLKSVVEVDGLITSPQSLASLVVGVYQGTAITLGQVATVSSAPDQQELTVYTLAKGADKPTPAVTLSIAKRAGSNATALSEKVLELVKHDQASVLGSQISMEVTRDYGHTAKEKSDELLFHMLLAIVGVSALIAWVLGWRAAAVVAIAIPTTLALTLASFSFLGYTLNRITLFALIFTIGILVDDPIVGVENIVRFLRTKAGLFKNTLDLTAAAMMEIISPLVLATIAVIAAIMPMAFVGGLMGPYMRPIPVGASIAMIISMLVSLIVTPWAAVRLLKRDEKHEERKEGALTRFYRWSMNGLLSNRVARWSFIGGIAILFVGALALVGIGVVRMKMLPFDNKNEFQVTLTMPEGSSVEQTTAVLEKLSERLFKEKEVTSVQLYAGTAAPYNFNGLVRHSFLKNQPNMAELQVNLLSKDKRHRASHAIAESLRADLNHIAHDNKAYLQVAELPPGPPVLSTLVVEVYGPNVAERVRLASEVEKLLSQQVGITDLVNLTERPQALERLSVDTSKATLNGISLGELQNTLKTALQGTPATLARIETAPEPVAVMVRLNADDRRDTTTALNLKLYNRFGRAVALKDLVKTEILKVPPTLHSKNLLPVNYVLGDVADHYGSPVYAMVELEGKLKDLKTSDGTPVKTLWTHAPIDSNGYTLKWDGEWQITFEVFRDLGIAFGVVLILIFILVVGWFKSFRAPIVVMAPIPLSLIGILPAHALAGMFFTATSMIGLIAGAGIVVRNAIILVDFIHIKLAEGLPLKEAVIEAGALRFRPMLLTAAAVAIGASVLLGDPIFQGLALSLIAGEVASTFLSRTAVPVLYYRLYRKDYEK
jgi:multidrug efflux pump subunit AcrB